MASRRRAEQLIRAGRVSVNGKVVREMGVQVEPANDRIEVDGTEVGPPRTFTYLMLHKPRNVLTASFDPRGRTTVLDLIPVEPRLFAVGRLDLQSEGLILLTDDGALANLLMHPRYGHEKEYRVLVQGTVSESVVRSLRKGVDLEDGRAAAARVRIEQRVAGGTWLRMVLREGRKRQIRRMITAAGSRVSRLIRVGLGPLRLADLPPGHWRPLTRREIDQLRNRAVR